MSENPIKDALISEGAALVGVIPAERLDKVKEGIIKQGNKGNLAGMKWLGRSAEKRSDPFKHLKDAKTIICSAWPYSSEKMSPYFSRYCQHKDYHEFIKEKMQNAWQSLGLNEADALFFVDSGAISEKHFAERAGLGFIGKNSLLINKDIGSYFCLGAILTNTDPVSGLVPIRDRLCGNCSLCINACPTKAIVSPGVIDCNRCISYLTIEHKGEIPEDIKPLMGTNIFGCDICQEACPYNKKVDVKPVIPKRDFGINNPDDLKALLNLDQNGFERLFKGTPIFRLGLDRLKRNVRIAINNL